MELSWSGLARLLGAVTGAGLLRRLTELRHIDLQADVGNDL